jgi:transposase
MKKLTLVGIDVSAKELVVALERTGGRLRESTFANDAPGHRKLTKLVTKNGCRAQVCVEATGVYHLDLCLALHATEHVEVMVVNPRAAKDFSRAQLQRSKTDRVDARSLLEFLRRMEFAAWKPPSAAILELRGLSRRIQALLVNRAQEKNRLHADGAVAETSPAIRDSIKRHIEVINGEIETLGEVAIELIETDNCLSAKFAHLVSVKGIAKASAITLLASSRCFRPT